MALEVYGFADIASALEKNGIYSTAYYDQVACEI